jgi:hypothetical protein
MSDKKVDVTISAGGISVDPTTIQVKKDQEKVKWESTTGPFTIDLPGHTVSYKAEGSKYVGVSQNFPNVGKHKYSVAATGVPVLDPDVDVIP